MQNEIAYSKPVEIQPVYPYSPELITFCTKESAYAKEQVCQQMTREAYTVMQNNKDTEYKNYVDHMMPYWLVFCLLLLVTMALVVWFSLRNSNH